MARPVGLADGSSTLPVIASFDLGLGYRDLVLPDRRSIRILVTWSDGTSLGHPFFPKRNELTRIRFETQPPPRRRGLPWNSTVPDTGAIAGRDGPPQPAGAMATPANISATTIFVPEAHMAMPFLLRMDKRSQKLELTNGSTLILESPNAGTNGTRWIRSGSAPSRHRTRNGLRPDASI